MSRYKLVYVDVNVFLDFACKSRDADDKLNAKEFFALVYYKTFRACTNASTLAISKPFIRREFAEKHAKEKITEIVKLLEIAPSNQKIVDEALASDFWDWEDALHYFSAIHHGADCIITRNAKDFKHSKIPILTPKQFIQNYLNNQ